MSPRKRRAKPPVVLPTLLYFSPHLSLSLSSLPTSPTVRRSLPTSRPVGGHRSTRSVVGRAYITYHAIPGSTRMSAGMQTDSCIVTIPHTFRMRSNFVTCANVDALCAARRGSIDSRSRGCRRLRPIREAVSKSEVGSVVEKSLLEQLHIGKRQQLKYSNCLRSRLWTSEI